MRLSEDGERSAADALDKLEPRRSALAGQLPEAGKEEAAAFERAQPAAAAELAKRQERGNLAREIIAERRQEQDQARERERSRDREQGMERYEAPGAELSCACRLPDPPTLSRSASAPHRSSIPQG